MGEQAIASIQGQISEALTAANSNAETRLDFNYQPAIDFCTQAIERLHALVLEIRQTDKETQR